jgi:nitroreductase
MDIPASRWYRVIEKRRSRRNYEERLPKPNHLKKIQSVCDNFRPFEGVRSVLVQEPPDNVFKGIVGAYGVIRGAKVFVAFIGNTKYRAVEEQVGYMGEGIVLEAEASGLNTCWIGGMFRKELVDSLIDLKKNERVYAISPVGYAKKRLDLQERVMAGFGLMHRRKSLSELALGLKQSEWPKWVKESLEAARLAPSAVNRQPWKFLVDETGITVAVNDKKLRRESVMAKRLCCGIAMLHLEVAANHFGVKGKWEFLNPPGVARYFVPE